MIMLDADFTQSRREVYGTSQVNPEMWRILMAYIAEFYQWMPERKFTPSVSLNLCLSHQLLLTGTLGRILCH